MSLINENLWATEFDTPLPEAMTYMLFNQLARKKQAMRNLDDGAQFIKSLKELPPSKYRDEWIQIELIKLNENHERATR